MKKRESSDRHLVSISLVLIIVCVFIFLPFQESISKLQLDRPWILSINLIAPTASPVRKQYSQLIEEDFRENGIYAPLTLLSWDTLSHRATDQEVGLYNEGGYDVCFFGFYYMALTTGDGTLFFFFFYVCFVCLNFFQRV